MRLSAISDQQRYDSLSNQIAAATAAGKGATVRYLQREMAKLDSSASIAPFAPANVPATIPIGVPVSANGAVAQPRSAGFGGLPMPLLLGGGALLLWWMMRGKKRGRK